MSQNPQVKQFAKLVLGGKTPFEAAKELFPDDSGTALKVSEEWPQSEEYAFAVAEIEASGKGIETKSKDEFANYIWRRMECADDDDASKFAKIYADVRGFIQKPNTNVNISNNSEQMDVNVSQITTAAQAEATYKEMTSGNDS